jgi:hypothetical protein
VDERAVLKHFDWPERKADTLREAAFGYQDLKKLESEVSNYKDDPRIPCDLALKKMITVSEKYGQVYYKIYFISRIKLGTEIMIGIPNSGRSEVFTVF